MFLYSLRITMDDDEAILAFFKDYDVLICKEGPDTEVARDHYHMIVQTDLKIPALRIRIRNHFGFKGNKDYSIKQPKDEEEQDKAIRYTCKGTKNKLPCVIKNITYDIDDFHRRYWEVRENIKHSKGKPKEECINFLNDYFDNVRKGTISEELICDVMLQWYNENGYQNPHRTVGQAIIMQITYNLGVRVQGNYKETLRRFYGVF